MTTAITIRGLNKDYGKFRALDGLDLDLDGGRIVGLLGENGCGKTTLLKVLAGALTRYDGDVRIHGHRPGPESKAMVSFLPDASFLPDTSTLDGCIRRYRDFFADFDEDHARELIGFFSRRRLHAVRPGPAQRRGRRPARRARQVHRRALPGGLPMIRTLFRNELRDTWRWLLALTGGAVLIVGMLTVVAAWLPQPLSSVSAGTAVVGAFAFPYAVCLLISLHYYRSAFSKTGYFTAAIPARGSTIFLVKGAYAYVVAAIGGVITIGLALLSGLAFHLAGGGTVDEATVFLRQGWGMLAELPGWLVALVIVLLLLLPLSGIAGFFFAATVGSESWINRSGFGGVVAVWFAYYLVNQLGALAAIFLLPSLDLRTYPDVTVAFTPGLLAEAGENAAIFPLGAILWLLVAGVGAMWWAKVSYDRKLELR